MIRALIIGLPLLFITLIGASFFNAFSLSSKKKNEMTVSLGGDPQNFNPIQLTDSASGSISNSIFSGLLKSDENLELASDLALTWNLSQTTTFFFPNNAEATAALAILKAHSAKWAQWHVVNASVDENRLRVSLSLPGIDDSQQIASLISPLPVSVLRVDFEQSSARKAFAAALAAIEKTKAYTVLPEKIWYDYDVSYEATVIGKPESALQELTQFHSTKGPHPAATVEIVHTWPFIAEPQIDFELRRDVKWHDGAPFTARDVAFTFRSLMDQSVQSPRKAGFDKVSKLETLSPYHVRVTYREPYSPALESWGMGILPAHILEGKPATWWVENFNRRPIGTGPFKFAEWKTSEYVRLVRNPLYFDTPPWLEAVTYRVIPDVLTQQLAFQTHQVDFWGLDPWAVKSTEKNPHYQLYSTIGDTYEYIGWNLRNPLFQDIRVRKAFAHAVNIPTIVNFILYGQGVQSTGIFNPNVWYFNPKIRPYSYDPAKAAALLDEVGWKLGPNGIRMKDGKQLAFTLLTPSNREIRKDVATLVQDDLRKIGVEVKIENYEWSVFISQHVLKQDFEAVVLGWTGGNYDQYTIWSSSQTLPGLLNFVGYSNPRVDRLLDQIREEYDRGKIIHLAGKLQSIIYEDQPYLFLFVPNGTTAIWKNAFRICRPDGQGGFINTPIIPTKAGWAYYSQWFYRPEYAHLLPHSQ